MGDRPDARLFWSSESDASILTVDAEPIPASHPDAFDLARLASLAIVLTDGCGREHALIADGARQMQLDIRTGTVLRGPVGLRYQIEGLRHIEARARSLQRLNAVYRLGRFPTALFPTERGGAKWARALQAYDGFKAGASQRDIACRLFSEDLVRDEWNGRSDFLRLRIQRLLAYGRNMVAGRWRALLD